MPASEITTAASGESSGEIGTQSG